MKSLPASALLAAFLTMMLLVACEAPLNEHNNSSFEDNDYFEEPLSARSRKFEPALLVSNQLVELIRDRKSAEVYELFSDGLKAQGSAAQVEQLISSNLEQFGDFVEYKPKQWSFTHRTIDGVPVIFSTKIVIHENTTVYYIFGFDEDDLGELGAMFFFRGNPDERLFMTLSRAL